MTLTVEADLIQRLGRDRTALVAALREILTAEFGSLDMTRWPAATLSTYWGTAGRLLNSMGVST